MKRLTTIADRLLSRFVPERSASANCWVSTYYICDSGPKMRCKHDSCSTEEDVCVWTGGWCW